MNTKNKNRENRRRELEKYSITKTLEGTQKRETSKSGKILTVDYVGMPCYGKIVKLVGFHPETPTIEKIVPIYQSCKNCGLYLGNLEEINSDVLDSMCIDCFKTEIGEQLHFSIAGESHILCASCELSLEKGINLFSKLESVCNHCYLKRANLDKDHSCIHCDPTFPIPKDSSIKKVYDDLEKTEILSKINKQREVEFEK